MFIHQFDCNITILILKILILLLLTVKPTTEKDTGATVTPTKKGACFILISSILTHKIIQTFFFVNN